VVPLIVTLKGRVAETFPSVINAGNILRGREQTLTYEISPIGKQSLQLMRAIYPTHLMDVDVKTHKKGLRVHIRLSPNLPYGDFSLPLTIATNDRFQPHKKTLVKGHVLERIICRPNYISFGVFHSPKDVRRTINLTSPYGHRFSIKKMTCTLPQVSLKLRANEPHVSQAITIHVGDTAPGPIEGQIEIVTISPDRSFKIPIHGLYLAQRPERRQ